MNLPEIPPIDDLSILLEQLKLGLIGTATDDGYELSDDEFKRIRKLILTNQSFNEVTPRFLKTCRNLSEFWQFIKNEYPTYAERRTFISESINSLLNIVEFEEGTGALEFSINYEKKGNIGEGGFGEIYLYEHKILKLPFAVKVFAPAFYSCGEKELERFFQEAKMLFQLSHPNIIKIYDAGLIGKRPFIRMEYFDGLDLNKVLQKFGALSLTKSLELIKNIAEGLNYAHEETTISIIHRDLKPSNIMVASPKKFRIIDFGLGIFVENEIASRFTKTGENAVGGLYTAPELIHNPKLIDKRSDIYSLGAIWYTCLTNRPPAGSQIPELLDAIDGMNSNYKNVIVKCLNNIENRYSSTKELLLDLEELTTETES